MFDEKAANARGEREEAVRFHPIPKRDADHSANGKNYKTMRSDASPVVTPTPRSDDEFDSLFHFSPSAITFVWMHV